MGGQSGTRGEIRSLQKKKKDRVDVRACLGYHRKWRCHGGRMWVGESAVNTMLCICPVADGDYDEFSCLG